MHGSSLPGNALAEMNEASSRRLDVQAFFAPALYDAP